MQRQSLGSPVSKLHSHGASSALSSAKDDALIVDDDSSSSLSKRRDSFLSSASLLPRYDEARPHRLSLAPSSSSSSSSSSSALSPRKPEKLIHLIPLLTLFCFLVLYLCSHSPSQTDLAQFSGFKRPAKQIVTTDIDEIGRDLAPSTGNSPISRASGPPGVVVLLLRFRSRPHHHHLLSKSRRDSLYMFVRTPGFIIAFHFCTFDFPFQCLSATAPSSLTSLNLHPSREYHDSVRSLM
ncbi:uncharacterized protein J3R85_001898 [Psidium guajava]|nr:uncharacterized protein J3R85_001898 [Psidium guajava]